MPGSEGFSIQSNSKFVEFYQANDDERSAQNQNSEKDKAMGEVIFKRNWVFDRGTRLVSALKQDTPFFWINRLINRLRVRSAIAELIDAQFGDKDIVVKKRFLFADETIGDRLMRQCASPSRFSFNKIDDKALKKILTSINFAKEELRLNDPGLWPTKTGEKRQRIPITEDQLQTIYSKTEEVENGTLVEPQSAPRSTGIPNGTRSYAEQAGGPTDDVREEIQRLEQGNTHSFPATQNTVPPSNTVVVKKGPQASDLTGFQPHTVRGNDLNVAENRSTSIGTPNDQITDNSAVARMHVSEQLEPEAVTQALGEAVKKLKKVCEDARKEVNNRLKKLSEDQNFQTIQNSTNPDIRDCNAYVNYDYAEIAGDYIEPLENLVSASRNLDYFTSDRIQEKKKAYFEAVKERENTKKGVEKSLYSILNLANAEQNPKNASLKACAIPLWEPILRRRQFEEQFYTALVSVDAIVRGL